MLSFLFISHNFAQKTDLSLYLLVFAVGVHADAVLQVPLVLADLLLNHASALRGLLMPQVNVGHYFRVIQFLMRHRVACVSALSCLMACNVDARPTRAQYWTFRGALMTRQCFVAVGKIDRRLENLVGSFDALAPCFANGEGAVRNFSIQRDVLTVLVAILVY